MPRLRKATDASGTVFYPISISKGIYDIDRNRRLSVTLADIYAIMEENRIKILGEAGGLSPTTTYAKNSVVTASGSVYISSASVTGLPNTVVTCSNDTVTCNGEAVTVAASETTWTKII